MNKYFQYVIFILIVVSESIFAQSLSIEECLNLAIKNHPLYNQNELIKEINEFKKQNIKAIWYPELGYNAQVSYQEPVLEVSLGEGLPAGMAIDFPTPNKDQYKTWFDVKQTIYDGGRSSKMLKIESLNLISEQLEHELSLENVKNIVADLFFNILVVEKQKEQLLITISELKEKSITIKALVERGTVIQANYDGLYAEILKLEQQYLIIENKEKTAVNSLHYFLKTDSAQSLVLSDLSFAKKDTLKKKEFLLMDIGQNKTEQLKALFKTQRKPVVFGFSQVGYGNPGLNILNDSFEPYFIVGAGLKWTITDWGTTKRNISIQQAYGETIELKRSHLNQQLKIGVEKAINEVRTYEKLMASDIEIIEVYKGISRSAYSQLENGTINTTDYLSELNNEKKTMLKAETNKIKYQQAIVNYFLLTGDL